MTQFPMPTSKSWIYHGRTGIVHVCWASPFIKYINSTISCIYIYIQLVPSLALFTASRGRVYTGSFHTSYIILLSICTSRIPCSTYKLKLHTSKQGTTSNMQSIAEASRERIQASHPVASCHFPRVSTMEGSNISACNSTSLIPPTSALSSSMNNCLVDCSDLQWRRKCCRVSSEALQSGHTLDT